MKLSKMGHRDLCTSLPLAEMVLLRELTDLVNVKRREGKWPGKAIHRAGVFRAALRYVLEHQQEFLVWMNHEYRELGRRDAE